MFGMRQLKDLTLSHIIYVNKYVHILSAEFDLEKSEAEKR